MVTAIPALCAAAKSTVHCRAVSIESPSEIVYLVGRGEAGDRVSASGCAHGAAGDRELAQPLVGAHHPLGGQQSPGPPGSSSPLGSGGDPPAAAALRDPGGARRGPPGHEHAPGRLLGGQADRFRGDVGVPVGAAPRSVSSGSWVSAKISSGKMRTCSSVEPANLVSSRTGSSATG